MFTNIGQTDFDLRDKTPLTASRARLGNSFGFEGHIRENLGITGSVDVRI